MFAAYALFDLGIKLISQKSESYKLFGASMRFSQQCKFPTNVDVNVYTKGPMNNSGAVTVPDSTSTNGAGNLANTVNGVTVTTKLLQEILQTQ